jgi:endonuclease YncB( thermonuclease family)
MALQHAVQSDQVTIEDGDTLLVRVAGVDYRIQLPDIDAPENVMNPKLHRDVGRTGIPAEKLLPLGERAAKGLSEILPSFQPYRLVFDPAVTDKYGRTPGDLLDAEQRPLSLRLVEAGYAVPLHPDAGREAALTTAADTARTRTEGLWGSHPEIMRAWAPPASR